MLVLLSVLLFSAAPDSPWDDYQHANPKAVAYVLEKPQRTWTFITAPDSPYAERRAVARRAGTIFDLSALRRIDALRAEFERSYWSYAPENSPYSSMGKLGDPADAGQTITLDGHPYTIPAKRPANPETFEQRSQAPWPWQARLALEDAWRSVLNSATRETFLKYAASLPCEKGDDAVFFRKATTEMAGRFREPLPVSLIGAWRNLLLRTESPGGNALSPFINTWALRYADRNAWLYAHVILLDRIKAGDVYGAAFHLQNLRERINDVPGRDLGGPFSYSAILEIGRWVMNNTNPGNNYVRMMAGHDIAHTLGEHVMNEENITVTPEKDQPEKIRLFCDWFVTREKELEKLAATETAELDRARKELGEVRQCRDGSRLSF